MLFKKTPTAPVFPYEWKMSDLPQPKRNAPTVFSTFCGAGGSTLGYKLAGFRSVGGNDLDAKQSELYRTNLKPEWFYEGFISDVIKQPDLPAALRKLDVLDGSPPCSLFSMAGLRERGWGKEKHFREGQAAQVLDLLFWDLIDLAAELQPKVVIGENVTGILKGSAREYVQAITRDFAKAGYIGRWYLVRGERVGLPQRRGRVFFIGLRKDLIPHVPDIRLHVSVDAPEIPFKDVDAPGQPPFPITPIQCELYARMEKRRLYGGLSQVHPKGSFFSHVRIRPDRACSTVTAQPHVLLHPYEPRYLNLLELQRVSSWPLDYDWLVPKSASTKTLHSKAVYGMGMSVPPILCAVVAHCVQTQWLKYLK